VTEDERRALVLVVEGLVRVGQRLRVHMPSIETQELERFVAEARRLLIRPDDTLPRATVQ
jgi:hypothetical protein